ncbi:hypothetical protein M0R45_025298 [Rubus argutus]|uniref:Uncharacterized protein n=1 Tax=Rubus argutus TaxID=59490 RepID=A0AAW1WWQ1_RUBAR
MPNNPDPLILLKPLHSSIKLNLLLVSIALCPIMEAAILTMATGSTIAVEEDATMLDPHIINLRCCLLPNMAATIPHPGLHDLPTLQVSPHNNSDSIEFTQIITPVPPAPLQALLPSPLIQSSPSLISPQNRQTSSAPAHSASPSSTRAPAPIITYRRRPQPASIPGHPIVLPAPALPPPSADTTAVPLQPPSSVPFCSSSASPPSPDTSLPAIPEPENPAPTNLPSVIPGPASPPAIPPLIHSMKTRLRDGITKPKNRQDGTVR